MKSCSMFFVPVFLFAAGLLAGQGPEAPHEDGVLLLMKGIALSYDGHHDEAQKEFGEYRRAHPDDLLVYLRIAYDRFFGKAHGAVSHDEYLLLLNFTNEAIEKYEKIGCAGTDLKSIAGTTLDCPYIGAALYSLRMTIVGKSDSWRKVGNDRNKLHVREKFPVAAGGVPSRSL